MLKAVNTGKAVTVKLPKDLTEEEVEALEVATVTLTNKDGEKVEAKYVADSYKPAEKGKEAQLQFELPEGKVLADTEEYTVTSELFEDAEFQARVGEEYVKEITSPTTSVPAPAEGVNPVVVFEATNQYSEKIEFPTEDVTYEVTWKGMPLVKGDEDDKDFTAENGKVTITKADIKEGDKLVVKVTYKDSANKDVEEVTAEKTFEVEKSAPAKVTEIVELKADKETVKPEDKVTVTATFKDQYGNAIELNENSKIRWVVEQGKDLIEIDKEQAENTSVVTKTGKEANKFTYTAKLPGDVKIQAYITENGASAKTPYEVTIGKADLKSLTVTEVEELEEKDIYNNKANVIGTVAPNEGAELVPEDVKFEITDAEGKAVAPETATAVAKYAEPEEDAEDAAQEDVEKAIAIEFKATKSGKYTVTPYVEKDGEKIYALEDTVKKGITVESKVENTVVDFTNLEFTKAEQKVKQPIEKDIEFVNEHGEPVLVSMTKNENRPLVYITSSNPDVVPTLEDVTKEGEVVGQKLVVTASEKGKTVLTIQAGDEIKTYNLEFVEAKLTTVNFAKEKVKDAVAGDADLTEPKAQYNKVTFLDQDEQEMDVEEPEFAVTTADGKETTVKPTDLGLILVEGAFNEKGEFVTAEELTEDQKAEQFVKVSASKNVPAGTYTVKVAESKEALEDKDAKVGTFTVEVGAVRDVDKIKAEPKSSTVALNGEVKVDLTVLDQYGEAHSVEDKKITAELIDPETEEATEDEVNVTAVEGEGKDGKYTATVTPEKLGTYDLVFTYTKGEGEEEVKVTETVSVHVGVAADVVKSIEFADFEDEDTERVLIKDGKPVYDYSTQGQNYTLTPKAKDADGNPVNFNAEELTWTSSNTDLVTVNGGEVQVVGTPTEDMEVTVTAKMLDVSQSITFVVSAEDAKALVDSITMTVPTEEATLEVTEVTIDENATDGAIEVTYTAVDQFGKNFAVDFTDTKIESFNPTVATAVKGSENNTIKITAVGEGETKIRTTIDGNDVDLKVIVTKEAVVIAQDAKTLADAATTANKLTVEELTFEGDTDEVSASKVKTKVEEAIEANKKGIDVAVQNIKDQDDVARNAQEDVTDQDAKEGTKATYEVTLTKGDAKPVTFNLTATFKQSADAKATEAADQFKTTHSAALALGVEAVQVSNKEIVEQALSDYENLGEEVQQKLTNEKQVLDNLKGKIVELEDKKAVEDAEKVVEAKDAFKDLTVEADKTLTEAVTAKATDLVKDLEGVTVEVAEITDPTEGQANFKVTLTKGKVTETVDVIASEKKSDEKAVTATTIGTLDADGKK